MIEKIRKKEITPIVAALLVLGELYVLCGILSLEGCLSAALCGIFGVGVCCLAKKFEERGWMVYTAAFGMAAALALILLPTFTDGCAALLNQVIDDFKQLHPRNYHIFRIEGDAKAAMRMVLALFALLIGMSACEIVRKPRQPLFYLHVVCIALLLLVFGEAAEPPVMTAAALCEGLLYLLYVSDSRTQARGMTEKAAAGAWLRCGAVFCILIVIAGLFPLLSDGDFASNIAESCRETVDDIRYGNNRDCGLTDGKLTVAGRQERTEESVLKVTMTEPASYYLRGFVGDSYQNNYWKPLEKEALYQNSDLFYWLHRDGFFAQKQITDAAQAADMKTNENEIQIENLKASSKYLYLPYETDADTYFDASKIGDSGAYAAGLKGMRNYSFQAAGNLIVQYQKIGSRLQKLKNTQDGKNVNAQAQTYLSDEAGYNAFVYQNYTQIPMEIEQYFAQKLGDYVIENGQSHFDYQAAKQNILFYLGKSVKYSEETEPVDGDVDFILNFLEGSKKGYDVHYASAAVMLFRYYGIPARYAEGYLITKEDAKQMKAGEAYYIDGTHAHAWAEYYQDGVGWLPFETTPSYLSVMEKTENYQDISGLLGQTVGSKRADEAEQQQETETDSPNLKMFWIKHKVTILLAASLMFLAALIALFISWLLHERKKTAARKADFMDEDAAQGIRNIHSYMMDVLQAYGLKPKNCNPIEYADFIRNAFQDETLSEDYKNAHMLWEEAEFSTHRMSEEERQRVLQVNGEIWDKVWSQTGFFAHIKLKYVYFL